jgi:PKD repeat protein
VSYNGPVTSRTWSFPGAVPETSTDITPVVTYSTPGWHTVTLTVNNGSGSDTKTWEEYLYVAPGVATFDRTYFGDFNSEAQTLNDWVLNNRYPDPYEWKWRGSNGYWNTGCIWLNSLFGPDLESDIAISPVFDLSDGIASNVFFKYATTSYGLDAGDYTMSLKLYYSNNCGDSWISMGKITGDDLITSFGGSSPLFPTMPEQWGSAVFSIPASAKAEHVQFKIEFVNNPYGNNVFIDDFNFITGVLSVEELNNAIAAKVVPNPVQSAAGAQLMYSLTSESDVYITISDLTGRTIQQTALGRQSAGDFTFAINPDQLGITAGCYFVKLFANGQSVTTRLVVL